MLWKNGSEGDTVGAQPATGGAVGASGNPDTAVSPGTGGSITVVNTDASHGSKCLLFAPASGVTCFTQVTVTDALNAIKTRQYFSAAAAPTAANEYIGGVRNSTTSMANWAITNTGKLRVFNTDASASVLGLVTIPFAFATKIRVEVQIAAGTTISNGSVDANWFLGDSTTPQEAAGTLHSATFNTGTTPVAFVRWGRTTAVTSTYNFKLDSRAFQTMAAYDTTPWPQTATNPVAVPSASNQYPSDATTVTLLGGYTDTGVVTSYSWAVTGVPAGQSNPTLATPAATNTDVTLPVGGQWKFTLTVTNEDGLTGSADFIVYAHADATADNHVRADTGTTSWTVTGAASKPAAVNDASAASYAESPTLTTTGQAWRMVLEPLGPEDPVVVNLEGYGNGAAVRHTVTLFLEDGTTAVYAWGPLTTGNGSAAIAEVPLTVGSGGSGTGGSLIPGTDLSTRRALVLEVSSTT